MTPDPARMGAIAKGLATKSAKIRALSKEGYSRSQIATFLGIRYQHVRGVLVASSDKLAADASGSSRKGGSAEGIRNRVRLKLDAGGRILIPAGFRETMELDEGSTVLAWLDGGELRLASPKFSMRRAQELARELIDGDDSLADDLIAERRDEARRELKDG